MSYILDALQKSDGSATPDALNSPPPAAPAGLALPWKIAIGAVLIVNLMLLYLWRTDRGDATATIAAPQTPATASPGVQASTRTPLQSSTPAPKKTLPGIASPRDLPPPRAQNAPAPQSAKASQSPTAGPRTFKPSGAAITIAESAPSQSSQPLPIRTQAEEPRAPARQRSDQPSRLSQLSDGAREALYVLTFSTHIYGDDADLRAVVVNGQRLTEGNSVSADNGQEFLLEEITDSGVILRFEYEGVSESVEIPVMEDWKDA